MLHEDVMDSVPGHCQLYTQSSKHLQTTFNVRWLWLLPIYGGVGYHKSLWDMVLFGVPGNWTFVVFKCFWK